MRRRDVIPGYVEFVSAVRIMGYGEHLKGSAPSIEAAIRSANRARKSAGKAELGSLEDMVAKQTEVFRKRGIPPELRERVIAWLDRKGVHA